MVQVLLLTVVTIVAAYINTRPEKVDASAKCMCNRYLNECKRCYLMFVD
jgi:hypothetical protein